MSGLGLLLGCDAAPSGGGGGGGIALVAHTYSTSGTSAAVDTTGATLLIAVASTFVNPTTVSDSKGNSWTALTLRGTGSAVQLFYAVNPTVGTGHTFTDGGFNFGTVCYAAFSGVDAVSPYDTDTGGHAAGNVQPGSITPAANNELLVAGLCWYPSNTVSIDSGFSITDQRDYTGNMGSALAYLVQGAAAAVNPTWSASSSFTDAAAAMAAFKPT